MPASAELIARVERDLKLLSAILATDPATTEVARVMRLPGTHNTKNGDNLECVVLESSARTYSLEELEDWLNNTKPLLTRRAKEGPSILDDIEAIAREAATGHKEPLDIEQMFDNLDWHRGEGGGNVYITMRSIIDSLLSRGEQVDAIIEYVFIEAEKRAPDITKQTSWVATLREIAVTWLKKHPGLLGDQKNPPDWLIKDPAIAKLLKERDEKVPPPPISYSYDDLRNMPIEPMKWVVDGFILDAALTGLFGDGGTGKDLVAFQLAIAAISGAKWLGRDVKQGRALYLPCEDDIRELRRREDAITRHYTRNGYFEPRSDDLKVMPMLGKDTIIGSFVPRTGKVQAEPAYDMLRRVIDAFKPTLVVVPNRVHLFSCNQISDTEAIQCLTLLHALCREFGCAVLMPAHPSVTGMREGTGSSGSVQWSNNVRLRLYLSRPPKPKADEPEPDTDERTLTVMKANWSPIGETINMRWSNGVFIGDLEAEAERAKHAGLTPFEIEKLEREEHEREFLRMLDKHAAMGSKVNAAPTANTYAPTLFAKDPDCTLRGKTGKLALRSAMDRLFAKNEITAIPVGPKSHMRMHIERVARKSHV